MLDKTYSPISFENTWYQRWLKADAFACNPKSETEPYVIMMPPPNVTGSLHIGHALTFTLQDILVRYYRMQGRDTLWQPGTDHAGIATQMVVERMLAEEGVKRQDLGRDAFIKRVWQWKEESGGTIIEQLRALGASADWARERFTMDEGLSHAVRCVFVKLHEEGLIYRDKRLINWDPKLQTAISDLEVEQREVKGHYWHLRYPIEGSDESIVVATTRPETMLGDTGVAVHPDDKRYKHLVGKQVKLPLVGRLIPIIADEYSDMEKGSGAVKITPGHDFNDFEVGKRHDLEMINIFTAEAKLNENVPKDWQALDRFKARDKVVAEFESLGLLEEIEETLHMVPHGDRSGVAIEPWLMDQWYVDAKVLAKPAIEAVKKGKTRIIPQRWEKTYFEWMENIQPWCISRQLWWGHRIPAWYGEDGEIFVAMNEEDALKQAEAHYGKKVNLTQDEDVLDTWFSSGLWPFSTLGWPSDNAKQDLAKYYPSSVLVTGFDIIFFWVARMMMLGMHFMDEVPFEHVYIHALVRDEKGQKMSKSKGNVLDPLDLSKKYGADALRFTLVAMAAQGRDIKLAESRIAGYRNFATKIWNASRFLQMNDAALDVTKKQDFKDIKEPVNAWIVYELAETEKKVSASIEEYKFNEAAEAIYQFIWHSYCDWYLEFIKPALADKKQDIETKQVASQVLAKSLQILHPMMPFITEELSEKVFGNKDMLITSIWQKIATTPKHKKAFSEIQFVIEVITAIRSLKNELNISPSTIPQLVTKETQYSDKIERLGRVKITNEADSKAGKSVSFSVESKSFSLSLADIDTEAERIRLEKEIQVAESEITKLENKLNSKGFTQKAPPEVVEKNRERLASEKDTHERLTLALKRLE